MKSLYERSHDPRTISQRARRAARQLGWTCQTIASVGPDPLLCLQSPARISRPKILLSAGMHGDEPAGIEMLLQFLESASPFLTQFQFSIFPLLNPWGLRLNVRHDQEQRDLNRQFRENFPSIRAIRQTMDQRAPYDLTIALHEDYDAMGYYLYELGPSKNSWGRKVLEKVAPFCPLDLRAKIERFPSCQGHILRPRLRRVFFDKIGLPEAPYHFYAGARHVFTLESPSEFDLSRRVRAHYRALQTLLALLRQEASQSSGSGNK